MNTAFCRFCVSFKRQCIVNPFPCAALGVAALLWIATPFVAFVGRGTPIEYLPPTIVSPSKVHAGQTVLITRSYIVTRIEPITILRRMEKGDCANRCDRVDLPSSELTNPVGAATSSRPLQIPYDITPGVWTMKFSITWYDFLGRLRSAEVPAVTIEVLP